MPTDTPARRRPATVLIILAVVLAAAVVLGWYGFTRGLLKMPIMGEVAFRETSEGGAGRQKVLQGLLLASGIAAAVGWRYVAGMLGGAGLGIFLSVVAAIYNNGMDRLELARKSPFQRAMAEKLEHAIQPGPSIWMVCAAFSVVLVIAFARPWLVRVSERGGG